MKVRHEVPIVGNSDRPLFEDKSLPKNILFRAKKNWKTEKKDHYHHHSVYIVDY